MQNKAIGYLYEQKAADFLIKSGYTVLERNYICPYGEIDLICENEEFIIFVEVKFRKSSKFGLPKEYVNNSKQTRIKNSSLYYISEKNITEKSFRYDVISFLKNDAEYIQNAFD